MPNTALSLASFGPSEDEITGSLLGSEPTLPKYYFQDIPADVMKEIMDGMMGALPKPDLGDMDRAIEEIDDWLNRHNRPATIPQWYDRAEEFLTTR